jgi:hypothetical protein
MPVTSIAVCTSRRRRTTVTNCLTLRPQFLKPGMPLVRLPRRSWNQRSPLALTSPCRTSRKGRRHYARRLRLVGHLLSEQIPMAPGTEALSLRRPRIPVPRSLPELIETARALLFRRKAHDQSPVEIAAETGLFGDCATNPI